MQKIKLDEQGSEIIYISGWLNNKLANHYFNILLSKIIWQEEEIPMFGRRIKVPRLIAWYGDPDAKYKYSGIQHVPLQWLPELMKLKEKLLTELNLKFNSVLANLYRNGNDYMGWHSDNEQALGVNPTIASISLGIKRKFLFRHKNSKEKFSMNLEHGSLLIMSGTTQHYWQHSLPKSRKIIDSRINLTFRKINIPDRSNVTDMISNTY